ncbi:MAG: 16S rRNA processing protein RimM [Polyangiaceae bacterium]|nr:16S rRNA processing protein RimM [Polyangiaceae bacterium]
MTSAGSGETPVEVGRVSRAHGLQGELRVVPFWAQSRALLEVAQVLLRLPDGSERTHRVSRARAANKAVLLALEGVDDVDAAAALKGAVVAVERAAMPPLGPGEYYLSDLVGAIVNAPDGEVGRAVAVVTHPTVDVLVIELSDGRRVEQPLVEHWIDAVDLERGVVQLASREGLIE